MANILAVLSRSDTSGERLSLEPWMLRDESADGMGLITPEPKLRPQGSLVAVTQNPAEKIWQLLAIRWSREENGQNLVGTQRLSSHPKRVEIHSGDGSDVAQDKTWGVFLPMVSAEQGVSNLLLPQTHYAPGAPLALRDGEVIYRLRLGEVHESHEDWLRVGMEVVGREHLAVST
jgi:hypothetical protein